MSRAESGQILATETVLERSRRLFETSSIEPFRAKGKSELVRASAVGRVIGRRGERGAETRLVGREHQLAALASILDDVKAGSGWTVRIAWLRGCGKARLLREALP